MKNYAEPLLSTHTIYYCVIVQFQTIPVDKMGILLSRAAQWTTASSGTGKLAFTPMNESLLEEILCFVEQFNSQHPQEAEHVFDEPLQWRTTLVASDFKTDYDIRLV